MSRLQHGFVLGDRVEAVTGPVAHGGHVVARVPDPTAAADARPVVVFVRHALPGERVVIEITALEKTFLRGDAVEVIEASPDRVEAPCPISGPGGCGGCDFQHVEIGAQRALKAAVVSEQLHRLAGISYDVLVEPVRGDKAGLRWRSRMQYVSLPDGSLGLRKNHSHEVIEVTDCLIAAPGARQVVVEARPTQGRPTVTTGEVITERVRERTFDVASDGFWQVHPGAPEALVSAVLDLLAPKRGEHVLDLYAGVGLFSAFLAEAVDVVGHVVSVESDRRASELAAENMADLPNVDVLHGRVDRVLAAYQGSAQLVVLDPPREGAKKPVVEAVVALAPRAVAYVACDPAALARDVATFAEHGYRLTAVRGFDLFPMTHHVECVALLERTQEV